MNTPQILPTSNETKLLEARCEDWIAFGAAPTNGIKMRHSF